MITEFFIQNLETKKYFIGANTNNKWDSNINVAKPFISEEEALEEMMSPSMKEDFGIGHFEIRKIISYAKTQSKIQN